MLTKVNNKTPKTAPKNCETISKTPLVEFMRDFPCHSIKLKVTAGLYCPPLILAEKMDSTQSEIASEKSLQDMKTKVNTRMDSMMNTNMEITMTTTMEFKTSTMITMMTNISMKISM